MSTCSKPFFGNVRIPHGQCQRCSMTLPFIHTNANNVFIAQLIVAFHTYYTCLICHFSRHFIEKEIPTIYSVCFLYTQTFYILLSHHNNTIHPLSILFRTCVLQAFFNILPQLFCLAIALLHGTTSLTYLKDSDSLYNIILQVSLIVNCAFFVLKLTQPD